jgi:hypothetical protein
MPRRDPLAVLARLRGIELDAARRAMAEAAGTLAGVEAAERRAEVSRHAEAAAAPADYAAWRPARDVARARIAEARMVAEARTEEARAALTEARAAARAVGLLREARREEARRARLARDEAALADYPLTPPRA